MADAQACTVCGEPGNDRTLSVCHRCDETFHLNERSDQDAKDCGQVWIDEQYLALRFGCQRCLDGGDEAVTVAKKPQMRQPRTGKRRYRRRD